MKFNSDCFKLSDDLALRKVITFFTKILNKKHLCARIRVGKGCETMIDLEENKRKLASIQEKIKSIGDSL